MVFFKRNGALIFTGHQQDISCLLWFYLLKTIMERVRIAGNKKKVFMARPKLPGFVVTDPGVFMLADDIEDPANIIPDFLA